MNLFLTARFLSQWAKNRHWVVEFSAMSFSLLGSFPIGRRTDMSAVPPPEFIIPLWSHPCKKRRQRPLLCALPKPRRRLFQIDAVAADLVLVPPGLVNGLQRDEL